MSDSEDDQVRDDALQSMPLEARADGSESAPEQAKSNPFGQEGDDHIDSLCTVTLLSQLVRALGEKASSSRPAESVEAPPVTQAAGRESRASSFWGSLEIGAKLGSGTFGTVYRAWDRDLEREVALKLFHGAQPDDGTTVDEARHLARIRHPNIVSVFGADARDGRVGFWMELVTGRTLCQLHQDYGPSSAQEAILVGVDLCHALAAVHQTGFLHCDLKAQNVMREAGGRIVLMDFGAAGTEPHRSRPGSADARHPPLFGAGGVPRRAGDGSERSL